MVGDTGAVDTGGAMDGNVPTLVNLSPHEVVLWGEDDERVVLPPAAVVPRLILGGGEVTCIRATGSTNGPAVEMMVAHGERLLGLDPPLPDPQPGVLYVTSRIVAEHCPERRDLAWPHELIRDESGQPVDAHGLAMRKAPVE